MTRFLDALLQELERRLKIITDSPWLVASIITGGSILLVFTNLPFLLFLTLLVFLTILIRLSLLKTFRENGIELPTFFQGSFIFTGMIMSSIVLISFFLRIIVILLFGGS